MQKNACFHPYLYIIIYYKQYTKRFTRQSLDMFRTINIITVAMAHRSYVIAVMGSAHTRQSPEACAPSVSRFRGFWEIFLPACLHLGLLTARCVWMIFLLQLYHSSELISRSLWKKKNQRSFKPHKCRFRRYPQSKNIFATHIYFFFLNIFLGNCIFTYISMTVNIKIDKVVIKLKISPRFI